MMESDMTSYEQIIVKKPWGFEYLMFQNHMVGIWYLYIKQHAKTSLHCHPRKKTGLILLSGEAVLSFLNDSVHLKSPSKLMIREGLFHSTEAVSPEGIAVIEVETPREKDNLVRLEDAYGRKEKPYEGTEAIVPLTENCIQLSPAKKGLDQRYNLHGHTLSVERVEEISELRHRDPEEIIVVLEGGLVSRTGEPIVGPGDVVSMSTLNRLAETFSAPNGISLLTIRGGEGRDRIKEVPLRKRTQRSNSGKPEVQRSLVSPRQCKRGARQA
ncbi:MAG: hypothetical protein QME83_02640 [Thermodesulfobacteriota bacterium]|nr:hypothetical protein [Thermodesulfobacteriota bacterium]